MRSALVLVLIAAHGLADTPVSVPRFGPAVGEQGHVRMAVSGDRVFAAWADNRGTGFFNDFTIFASLIDGDGGFVSPQGFLVSDATVPLSHDVVAIGDRFIVVWHTRKGAYARAYDRDAAPLGEPRLLLVASSSGVWPEFRASAAVAGSRILVTTGVPVEPLLLIDPELRVVSRITTTMTSVATASDGRSFLAYDAGAGSAWRIDTDGKATRLATDGRYAEDPARLIWTGRDYALVSADVKNQRRPYAVRLSTDGRSLSRRVLSNAGSVDADVDLASPGDGTVLAVWSEYPYDIHVGQLEGNLLRRAFADTRAIERFPAIVWTGSRYLLAWTASGELTVAFADREGRRVGEGRGVLASATGQQEGVGSRGLASEWIAWVESDGVTRRVWIGNALRPGGTTIARAAFDRGPAQSLPRLATTGDQLLVAWVEEHTVRARRFRIDGEPVDAEPLDIPCGPECTDLSVIWDGSQYLLAFVDGREISMARLARFGPLRGMRLLVPDRRKWPRSLAFASGGQGSLLVFTDWPCGGFACIPSVPAITAVQLDRNGELTDTRLLTIGRGIEASRYVTDSDVAFNDGIYVVLWRDVAFFEPHDDRLRAALVDLRGAVQPTPAVIATTRRQSFSPPTIAATAAGPIATVIDAGADKLLTIFLDPRLAVRRSTSVPFAETNARVVARPSGDPAILYHRRDAELGVIRLFVRALEGTAP